MKKFLMLTMLLFVLLGLNFQATAQAWQNEQIKIDAFTNENEVLIKLTPLNGGHILWDNPGDIGTPTTFQWSIPATRLNESVPQKFEFEDIFGQYGYEKPAYYLFDVQNWDGATVHISWTICQEECFPQSVSLKIRKNPNQSAFEEAQQTFPLKSKQKIAARMEKGALVLTLPQPINAADVSFAPLARDVISPLTKAEIKQNGDLYFEAQENATLPSGGLLWLNQKAYRVELEPQTEDEPWFLIFLLSFLGGMVLNFMPCVFPVLSLKALALVHNPKPKSHALQYLSGVLCCFGLMACLLIALRQSGVALGWGFQLQSPVFVSIMLGIFIFVCLLMLGIIKIKGRLQGFLERFSAANSFLTGLVSVLIASPCSGPLLGATVGYALLSAPQACLPIFLTMGLGYALPFTLMEAYPHVISRFLPAPGKWMQTLSRILAVPVFLTCLWLAWLLAHLLWLGGSKAESVWQPYDKARIENLLAENKPVFIDFGAKWCLTCLINEKAVLDMPEFQERAKACGISLFKADWTNQSKDITQALASYARASVPLYVYYPAGKNYEIWPQILTTNIVKEHLNECTSANRIPD